MTIYLQIKSYEITGSVSLDGNYDSGLELKGLGLDLSDEFPVEVTVLTAVKNGTAPPRFGYIYYTAEKLCEASLFLDSDIITNHLIPSLRRDESTILEIEIEDTLDLNQHREISSLQLVQKQTDDFFETKEIQKMGMYGDRHKKLEFMFIAQSSDASIRDWLERNRDEFDLHSDLREQYEPIWAERSPKLRLAVALYGKDVATLRNIFLMEEDSIYRRACADNSIISKISDMDSSPESKGFDWGYFLHRFQAVETLTSGDGNLTFLFFKNPALNPEFISHFFSNDDIEPSQKLAALQGVNETSKKNLNGILAEPKQKSDNYDNNHARSQILKFITTLPAKLSTHMPFKNPSRRSLWLYDVQYFLEHDQKILWSLPRTSRDGIEDYSLVFFSEKLSEEKIDDDIKDLLDSIRFLLYASYFKKTLSQQDLDYLRDCRHSDSEEKRIRSITYSPLAEAIGSHENPVQFHGYPNLVKIFGRYENPDEENQKNFPSDHWEAAINRLEARLESALADRIEEFGHKFFAALIFREQFYRSAETASWLRSFCEECDSYMQLSDPFIFLSGGVGAAHIFDTKLLQLHLHRPDAYISPDELSRHETFKKEMIPISNQLEHLSYKLTALQETADTSEKQRIELKEIKHQLKRIEEKSNELQSRSSRLEQLVDLIYRRISQAPKTLLNKFFG